MKHIDPVTLVLLGIMIAVMGFLLSIIGGFLSGTSLSEARNPTGPGVYRRMPFGLYMKVLAPVDLNDLGVKFRFIPAQGTSIRKIVVDENGVLHRLMEAPLSTELYYKPEEEL